MKAETEQLALDKLKMQIEIVKESLINLETMEKNCEDLKINLDWNGVDYDFVELAEQITLNSASVGLYLEV